MPLSQSIPYAPIRTFGRWQVRARVEEEAMVRVLLFFRSEIAQLWQAWTAYNPERHYMRGPGPKWREVHAKHGEPAMRIDGANRIVSVR
jgi:hypothetical protein